MPERPQKADGNRIEPAVSEPVPPSTKPAATATPVPLEDPPVKCSIDHGLQGSGKGKSKLGPPIANSCVASLPKLMMPASVSLETVVASRVGTCSISSFEWAVVGMLAVS